MLFKYLYKSKRKKYLFLFIFTVVAILLISFLDIMQGVMFMIFMNRAIGINNISLWVLGLGALGFVVGYYLVSLLASYLINLNLKKIRGELVYDIFVSYSNYPTAKFLKEETPSSITSIITTEVENLIDSYYTYILQIFSTIFSFVLGIIYLGLLNLYIVIPILVFVVIIFLVSFLTAGKVNKNYKEVFLANKYVIKLINNIFNFFTISKMFTFKDKLYKHIDEEYDKFNVKKTKARVFDVVLEKVNGVLSLLMFFSIYIICVYLAIENQMNAGEITSIIQVCGTIINPFFAISYIIKAIANTKSTRDKISKIITIPTPKNSSPRLHVNKISVKNLSFSYTNKQNVINNLSFNFNLGDIVAIVGESGSGKSTLLSLLSKFIDGYTGLILINDSVNLIDISDEIYYSNIKILNQEPILLNDSIKNNIILDRPFDEQKFNEIFGLLNLGKSFKDINTKIDTETKNYSLGEARRICLARLLYEKPNFILLDEPFASLDEENRLIIENALLNISGSCIVIASHVFSDNFKNHINKKIEL